MPRRKLPPRLYLRAGRSPGWVIKDGDREIRTGFGPEYSEDADELWHVLLHYRAARAEHVAGPLTPECMKVGDALSRYGQEHAPTTAAPARIGYAIAALATSWGDLPVAAVKGATCRSYAKQRGVSDGTVRRELGCLRAALVHCEREGYLTAAPLVWLPDRPPSRERWLTRREAAGLLRAALRLPKGRHLARFILIGLYTGTRKDAILRLQWQPNTDGGHVNLEAGLLYRASISERQTKKRAKPVKIPRQLLSHLKRWKAQSLQYVIEYQGRPVRAIQHAWEAACDATGLHNATPHTLKHTAVTWAMQRGADKWDLAGFFSTTFETLERTYGHHHTDHQRTAVAAMENK